METLVNKQNHLNECVSRWITDSYSILSCWCVVFQIPWEALSTLSTYKHKSLFGTKKGHLNFWMSPFYCCAKNVFKSSVNAPLVSRKRFQHQKCHTSSSVSHICRGGAVEHFEQSLTFVEFHLEMAINVSPPNIMFLHFTTQECVLSAGWFLHKTIIRIIGGVEKCSLATED